MTRNSTWVYGDGTSKRWISLLFPPCVLWVVYCLALVCFTWNSYALLHMRYACIERIPAMHDLFAYQLCIMRYVLCAWHALMHIDYKWLSRVKDAGKILPWSGTSRSFWRMYSHLWAMHRCILAMQNYIDPLHLASTMIAAHISYASR